MNCQVKKAITAVMLLLLIFMVIAMIVQRYMANNDEKLFSVLRDLKYGMSIDQVKAVVGDGLSIIEWPSDSEPTPGVKYRGTKYMGMITSRNLVVYFDGNMKLVWMACENT